MIELERHIEILLLNNDCVIVPELGGFMAHHIDARYDEEEDMFLPPLRTLGFNPQLNINDSLLAQSYVEAYDISYPEALRRIEDEVNELKQHLQNEGSYELNDIGVLSLNEDGHYLFTPCEAGILTPELYGLSSFDIVRTAQAGAKVVNIASPQVETEEKNEVEAQFDTTGENVPEVEMEEELEEEEDDDDVIKLKFSWVRNAVAVAAVFVAIFLLALPTGKKEMVTRTISNINNSVLFGMISQDTNCSKVDIKRCDIQKPVVKTDTTQVKKQEPPVEEAKKDSVRQGYCIVLASQVSMKNAKMFVEYLQKKGYDNVEIYVHNNITRVIYGNYATQMDAVDDLRSFHRNKDLTQAWIYKFN